MPDRRVGTWDRFVTWLNGADCLVYSSHVLSSWGNRMWQFSLGITLVALDGGQLRTVAAYGLTVGCAVILFMALIGDWIDRTERLRVVKISLVIQNALVIVTAVVLCLVLVYHDDTKRIWSGQLKTLCLVVIICLATIARLASEALKIAVEKDWVVVIAQRLNASMRRIDLVTNILSPAVIGQVITFVSLQAGALVVAGWNLFSMFFEYYLLVRLYQRVPNLSIKSQTMAPQEARATSDEHEPDEQLEHPHVPQKEDTTRQKILTEAGPNTANKIEALEEDEDYKSPYATTVEASTAPKKGCCRLMFNKFIIFYQGFGTYLRQEVVCAGLGLGFLYMTVLGFDSITIGFAYDQGVSASILGILMAVGSIVGILGTVCFTLMRRRIGLERTGLFSFSFEIACLILCVVSVWTPGSPFFGYNERPIERTVTPHCRDTPHIINVETIPPITVENSTVFLSTTPASVGNTTNSTGTGRRKRDDLHLLRHSRDLHLFHGDGVLFYPHIISSEYQTSYNKRYRRQTTNDSSNTTGGPSTAGVPPGYSVTPQGSACKTETITVGASYISVTLLMAGIITARFGLWMADLTVTQVLQENVEESQRGVVNGVQTALNMFMDTIKFIIVIIAPREETFGILIVVSFVFICIGSCFYARYSYTVRGHLFHFDAAAGRCRSGKKNGTKRPGDTLASFRTDDQSTSVAAVA